MVASVREESKRELARGVQWTGCGLCPLGSCIGSLVLRVVVVSGGVKDLQSGAWWEVIKSLRALPLGEVDAILTEF